MATTTAARLQLVERAEYTLEHACGVVVTLTAAELAAATSLPPCPCEAEETQDDPKDAA